MRSIDEYNVEVMISLAVVMGGYRLAHWLHVSGPVAMAVAGLLIGNAGVALAMSDTTRDYLLKFWALIDEPLAIFAGRRNETSPSWLAPRAAYSLHVPSSLSHSGPRRRASTRL